jgi:hypothetical protein
VRRTTLAVAVLIPACALALTACGSSGGSTGAGAANTTAAGGQSNASLSSSEINSRIDTALKSITAMHAKGSITQSGSTITMDLQLNKDGSAQGSVGEGGTTIPLTATNGVDYFQVTPSLVKMIEAQDSSAADQLGAELMQGHWISSQSGLGASLKSSFSSLTDLKSMTEQISSNDTLTYLHNGTVAGQQVAQYKDVSPDGSSPTATISVPLTGDALPILEDAGSQGQMTFTWNEPTKVSAPPADEVLDLPSSSAS